MCIGFSSLRKMISFRLQNCFSKSILFESFFFHNASLRSQNILDAPSITPHLTKYNFTEGNNIVVSCVTDGKPQPTITWTKIGEPSNVAYPDTQTLTITRANRTDAGAYKCTATNGIGESASATIHVNMFCK